MTIQVDNNKIRGEIDMKDFKSICKVYELKKRFKRGEIYWVDFPEQEKGSHIQAGLRPAIIIVNDKAGKYSPVVQCIPVTTEIKREDLPVHMVLNSGELREVSMVLGEQLGSVDTYRIQDKIGEVSYEDMCLVDFAAVSQLGINVYDVIRVIKNNRNNSRIERFA